MNSSLYISFFQGQLESALEQVVQLAVTEITDTVGASLSSMLLETARKEQDNQRLRASIQSAGRPERERGEGAEPEAQHAAPRPLSVPESLRQEQKKRAVGQLKMVMERVLEFAVCELSKVVEDSFDDVLLEFKKTEQENEELMEKLREKAEENSTVNEEKNESRGGRGGPPNLTHVVKEEKRLEEEERGMEQTQNNEDSTPQAVLSVSQDWVPVLDQVFGQKWCADIWPVKEPGEVKAERSRLPSEEAVRENSAPHSNVDSQSDRPQWLQNSEALTVTFDPQKTSEMSLTGDDVQLKSPSMLHRLLTLPSQLLDGDDESMESEDSLLNAIASLQSAQTPHHDIARADDHDPEDPEEDEDEGQEEEAKPRSCRSGKKNHTCKTCGRKFGRAHLLKAHRLTHKEARSPFSKLHPHACTNSGKNT
ncbi:zinc finger protein 350 isoform X2 [Silurus asotus]|uniref:Zinc finger protein 350 isoform X2 n=1 Tax=Silurus asotus TaxID=30991 RepID=A0AAD5A4B8_SILAS|nr:zinc finger protein 350 isoform X2 [Silurus asotus]